MTANVGKHEHFQPFKYFFRFNEDSNLSLIFSAIILGIALLAILSMTLLLILNH